MTLSHPLGIMGRMIGRMPEALTDEVEGEAWERTRDEVAQHFLGMSAEEFVKRYKDGEFEDDDAPGLMAVLSLFPELD